MVRLPVGVEAAAAAPPLKMPPQGKKQIASEVAVQPCQEPPTSTATHSSADIYFNAWKGTNAFEAMLKDGILYPTYGLQICLGLEKCEICHASLA